MTNSLLFNKLLQILCGRTENTVETQFEKVFVSADICIGKAQALQIKIRLALLYLGFPVNHDSVTVSQHAQYLKLKQQSGLGCAQIY